MAINFNKDSVFNLKPIEVRAIKKDIMNLMVAGEEPLYAFKTIRDQVVFTNKRIITIDVQGVVGKKKEYAVLPYSRIQYFSIQTPGLIELFPDNELFIRFSDGFESKFEFKGYVDIAAIAKVLSEYIL